MYLTIILMSMTINMRKNIIMYIGTHIIMTITITTNIVQNMLMKNIINMNTVINTMSIMWMATYNMIR